MSCMQDFHTKKSPLLSLQNSSAVAILLFFLFVVPSSFPGDKRGEC